MMIWQTPLILHVAAFLTGLIVGSFLNSCIYRIPRGISLLEPKRSFCPSCNTGIPSYLNIPVISYLILRGRCSYCKSRIPAHYPIIELFCGAAFALTVWGLGMSYQALIVLSVGSILLTISIIDWQHFRIPNSLLIVAGFILVARGIVEETFVTQLLAGLFAGVLLIVIRQAGNYWLKRESMGLGDVKLGIVMGMALGISGFLFALFIASALGLLFAAFISLMGYSDRKEELPFGTYLAVSTILLMYTGTPFLSIF